MAGGFISSKEREALTLLSKDTEYASDLQTYGWKFAQKFPPKQPFRRKANRNRSTIRSSSENVASQAAAVRRSYPAVNA